MTKNRSRPLSRLTGGGSVERSARRSVQHLQSILDARGLQRKAKKPVARKFMRRRYKEEIAAAIEQIAAEVAPEPTDVAVSTGDPATALAEAIAQLLPGLVDLPEEEVVSRLLEIINPVLGIAAEEAPPPEVIAETMMDDEDEEEKGFPEEEEEEKDDLEDEEMNKARRRGGKKSVLSSILENQEELQLQLQSLARTMNKQALRLDKMEGSQSRKRARPRSVSQSDEDVDIDEIMTRGKSRGAEYDSYWGESLLPKTREDR